MTAEHRAVVLDGVARKFENPDWTARGEPRASVPLSHLDTLWINTGTLCNITCRNCYIESSPANDRLAYISAAEVTSFLGEAQALKTREIGFTGGEPFLNAEFPQMVEEALGRGFEVLILTNAMLPMQRPRCKDALSGWQRTYNDRLTLRVSLDHYTAAHHETERGPRTWAPTIDGIDWLARHGFQLAIAGRTCWGESETETRAGFARLFAERQWPIDAQDRSRLILFPEMDGRHDVPEITTACWGILKKSPSDLMCATSRMIVKRKGADRPVVLPCTLLPYDRAFEMGSTLTEAAASDGGMFRSGAVKLCHAHCAKFCVLGGGSCS
ncbi:MAG: radical SAM protein [Hyphomicrobium sp.]